MSRVNLNDEDDALIAQQIFYNLTEDILVQMNDKNITLDELAAATGISIEQLNHALYEPSQMTGLMLSHICVALGVCLRLWE